MNMAFTEQEKQFTRIIADFTSFGSKHLPDDVLIRLKELRKEETSEKASIFYDAMFKDLEMAEQYDRPLCQDTGVIQYFVRAGSAFPLLGSVEKCLREAARISTKEAPLRHNCVNIFDEKNTGDNTGVRIPWIDWEIVPDSPEIQIYMYMAGGGCSLPGCATVLMPLDGYEGVVKYVFDRLCSYGINACPPLLVGIGIGGSVEVAARLSKIALLRPVRSCNENAAAADLESRIEKGLNDLNFGPGGITGKYSVMGVNIEQAGRHPSTLAVGLSTGCWAHRRALIRIDKDMNYELLSHKGARL